MPPSKNKSDEIYMMTLKEMSQIEEIIEQMQCWFLNIYSNHQIGPKKDGFIHFNDGKKNSEQFLSSNKNYSD